GYYGSIITPDTGLIWSRPPPNNLWSWSHNWTDRLYRISDVKSAISKPGGYAYNDYTAHVNPYHTSVASSSLPGKMSYPNEVVAPQPPSGFVMPTVIEAGVNMIATNIVNNAYNYPTTTILKSNFNQDLLGNSFKNFC